MSRWTNIGIAQIGNKDKVEEILNEEGLKTRVVDDGVKATTFSAENRHLRMSDIKDIVRENKEFNDAIVIIVDANDTSDAADGKAFRVNGSELERISSKSSGGESTRRNWYGISKGGVNVDGSKNI
jgi:nitrogen regulatory protein PII